ncbi:MAG: hypothetical protein ACXWWQ_03395 [Candidatus Limnocylindria bacterium]
MALIAPLIAFIGRQVGRIVQMAFGWATIMLFGRVPQSKQFLLALVALGSIAWVLALIGVAFPDVGAFLITFIPRPDFVDEGWVHLAMLVLAIVLPIVVGIGGLMVMDAEDRPKGIGGKVVQVLRGYPYAAVLATVILFLIIVAPIFKLRTIIRRWEDAHIPIVVQPGRYEKVAADLEQAVDAAGLELARGRAPRVLEIPSQLLAAVGGAYVRRLVPDRIVMLRGQGLEVTIHPSDVAVAGKKDAVARARAAVAVRLTKTDAYLTSSKESQEVEDVIQKLAESESGEDARTELEAIDERLASLVVPYEEWEVLYRQRLQVERDMLKGQHSDPGNADGDQGGRDGRPGVIKRMVRTIGGVIR